MPLTISAPSGSIWIKAEPLTKEGYSPFGTVITNPRNPSAAISANQGSALKYIDVSPLLDFYAQAPSHVPSKAAMNMFVCSPRTLSPSTHGKTNEFKVEILERHPFTTQTFSPLGSSEDDSTKFLVIVAPTLPLSEHDIGLAVPRSSGTTGAKLPGRGLPDLSNLKAFVANGSQAVTYGAGTWHAPMVVVGKQDVAFVVSQFVNGVGEEDCQEVVWEGDVRVGIEVGEVKKFEDQVSLLPATNATAQESYKDQVSLLPKTSATGLVEVVTDRLGVEGKKAIHGDKSGLPKL